MIWLPQQPYPAKPEMPTGKTWTFVDGEGMTPEKIRYILPSYADQPLPDTIWTDGTID